MNHSAAPIVLLGLLAASAVAQTPVPERTLADLERSFREQFVAAQERADGRLGPEEAQKILRAQADELRAFLDDEAQGDDKFNGRLMLTDRLASVGDFDAAKKALQAMDVEACPALILLTAADLANRLQLTDLAAEWKQTALAKDAPFEDRMTMGMLLMTVFVDIEGGEKLFSDAMAEAADDEAKARVDWYRALAIREREDLPEGAFDEELRRLASKWPGTRYGTIARDRLQAMEYDVGVEPLPLDAKDIDGEPVELAEYEGKVVLIDVWASWSEPWLRGVPFLRELRETHGDDGLVILGICLDEDLATARATMTAHGIDWRQIWDGKGWESDLVKRQNIETVPHTMLIGRDGKIAALTLHATSESGRSQLREAVERALAKKPSGDGN